MATDSETLAAHLARIFPLVRPADIGTAARSIVRAGRAAQRIAEDECNRQPIDDCEFTRRREFTLEHVRCVLAGLSTLTKSAGKKNAPRIVIEITGDPRGYCLRLHNKKLGYNTLGGEEGGYGV